MTIADRIVAVAEEFEGLVEIKSNAEWDDPNTRGTDAHAVKFEEMIKRAGHQDGWPYCMSFSEGVWVTAYEDAKASKTLITRIKSLLSPSVMNSFQACKDAGLISKAPKRGAIMFMQSGASWKGHAGLVRIAEGGWINLIEANTSSSDANERDGGIGTGGIWRKKRAVTFVPKNRGLWIRGFLNPIDL
jgi:hypothetical protein